MSPARAKPGEPQSAAAPSPSALEVLAVNVGLLMLAGTTTLFLQRRWQAHEAWPWPR